MIGLKCSASSSTLVVTGLLTVILIMLSYYPLNNSYSSLGISKYKVLVVRIMEFVENSLKRILCSTQMGQWHLLD